MIPTPHVIESALLLLAAYLLGCVIGFFLRRAVGARKGALSEDRAPEQEKQANP